MESNYFMHAKNKFLNFFLEINYIARKFLKQIYNKRLTLSILIIDNKKKKKLTLYQVDLLKISSYFFFLIFSGKVNKLSCFFRSFFLSPETKGDTEGSTR